jgi:hypothetical protein
VGGHPTPDRQPTTTASTASAVAVGVWRESAEIDAVLDEVAGHLNAQHARLVDVAVRLLADDRLWAGPGVHSVTQFLAWKTAVTPARARQLVAIAERAAELPVCVEALRAGELSVDQVAAVARRVPWWADEEVCELAKQATVTQLARALAAYPFPDIPRPDTVADEGNDTTDGTDTAAGAITDDAAAEGAVAVDAVDAVSGGARRADADPVDDGTVEDVSVVGRDRCSFGVGDDGRFRMWVETDAEAGMVIEAALTEARDAAFGDGHHDVTWPDALREIAERSLDAIPSPSRRHRFRINLHLDTRGAVDPTGARLPDAVRRHVGCDGLLSPVFTADGLPVSVGRARHLVPDRTRRLVTLRDQGCRVPGCTHHRHLEIHHIIHWLDGGPTDTDNLICLCPHHHRLHHRGRLGITGNADTPDGITFTTHHHTPITRTGARPRPPDTPPPPPIGTYRHPHGGRLDTRWLYFNPPRTTAA